MKKMILASMLISTLAYCTPAGKGPVIEFQATRGESVTDVFKKKTGNGAVVVDFYADWCGPCKSMSPIFIQVAKEFKDITFMKVNIDTYKDIAQHYGIRSIPQIFMFKDGKHVHTLSGKQSKTDMKKAIKQHLT